MTYSSPVIDLREATIAGAHRAMAAGQLSCEELAAACAARMEAMDKVPPALNAVIALNPRAAAEGKALDEAARAGAEKGPLHGIPVLLKDNVETRDMPTTAGSLSLAGWQTGRDAFIAEKLREAGAVIVAKTNLHEFAVWGETVSSVLGQTYNPYDYSRTPGGSSGGTGAALAAGFALAGIGTDTINSIRSPASACALCGIRPTVGLVSRAGIVPYSLTQDTAGPLARTVEDAVRVLSVIAGYDPADPATEACKGRLPENWMTCLNPGGLAGTRIGVLRSFFGREEHHRPVNRVMAAALRMAAEAGAVLVVLEDEIDSGTLVRDVSVHLHDLKTHLGEYLSAFGAAVPVHSVAEILASGKYTPGIEENLRTAEKLGVTSPDYPARLARRAALQQQVLAMMDTAKLDAICYPHQQQLVCKAGQSQIGRNGALASVTGYPAIVVPAGFSAPDASAPLGVPVGIEFAGRPFDEARLIGIAHGFEQSVRARRSPFSPHNPAAGALAKLFSSLV